MTTTTRQYGWKKQDHDQRDLVFSTPELQQLPVKVDLRPGMPAVWDQGQTNSCTAFASCAAFAYDQVKQGLTAFTPSRLFQYYSERVIDQDIPQDQGSTIRTACKALASVGVCSEEIWPFETDKLAERPSVPAYHDAMKHKAVQYSAIHQDEYSIKHALSTGFPVLLGIMVYSSLESEEVAKTGIVPLPAQGEQCLGGHAILLVGYDDAKQLFTFRNSWGTGWGNAGYGYLPYAFVTNPALASDFWIVTSVSKN